MLFRNSKVRFFKKISWLDCEQYGKNQSLSVTNALIIPMIFNFLFCENAYDNENSVVKIQNLIVNHESRPVKLLRKT